MISHLTTKTKFLENLQNNRIEAIVLAKVKANFGRGGGAREVESWKQSLGALGKVLNTPEIPGDMEIGIEYQVRPTGKRIDVILYGLNKEKKDQVVIIELKQWTSAEMTIKDGVIKAFVGATEREVAHPSYQALVYANLLRGFTEVIHQENIVVTPCVYLHNYERDGVIDNIFYKEYVDQAPLFFKGEENIFRKFIAERLQFGAADILEKIEQSAIKPSHSVAEQMPAALYNEEEFTMIDDQKVVFETILELVNKPKDKQVVIVKGGPGTGKSVVAINLLINLIRTQKAAQYVTKNAAPRAVYEHMLKDKMTFKEFCALFSGSGAYQNIAPNTFEALIVDEAHRLNERTGMYGKKGGNQVREIIQAAKCSIFFLDEDQKVTWNDFGSQVEIEHCAANAGARIHYLELNSQFRCGGSDNFLDWLDNTLQIKNTGTQLTGDFDFRVVDSPQELQELIREKNKERNKARIVAGRCWDWISEKNPDLLDIKIREHNFTMRWNLNSERNTWIISPTSVEDVGCIHSAQGLEIDYIGVIVGPDLIVRNGQVIGVPEGRAKTDTSLKGFKTLHKIDPDAATKKANAIIKNTYRTLMTRGMKGCYVYFMDKEAEKYFKDHVG